MTPMARASVAGAALAAVSAGLSWAQDAAAAPKLIADAQ